MSRPASSTWSACRCFSRRSRRIATRRSRCRRSRSSSRSRLSPRPAAAGPAGREACRACEGDALRLRSDAAEGSAQGAQGMSAGRPSLTVIVPTFNEEATLRDCLDSVRFADEILVVDSYSSDATVAIARELGARVLQHEYVYSAKQKNWSIPQATHEWVLLVDSDERVTPELREEILALLAAGPRHDGYWIPRANHFLGRRIRRCGWGTDKVIRLFRRDVARYQDREVHAEIDLPGPLPVLRHALEHRSFRSFGQYWRKLQIYSAWGAAQLYKEGRRAGRLPIV